MVNQIQEKTKIQDPQQITGYIQQAAGAIKEEVNAHPQSLESLFREVLGGTADTGGAASAAVDASKGFGERLKGFFSSK